MDYEMVPTVCPQARFNHGNGIIIKQLEDEILILKGGTWITGSAVRPYPYIPDNNIHQNSSIAIPNIF